MTTISRIRAQDKAAQSETWSAWHASNDPSREKENQLQGGSHDSCSPLSAQERAFSEAEEAKGEEGGASEPNCHERPTGPSV